MGLAGARNSAVTGIQAQSTGISISADNIANAGTPGYKAVKSAFSTLVTSSSTSTGFSSGGVSVQAKTLVETQGLIEATSRATDLAISGAGFFAVQDDSGNLLLSRAGSFEVNNKGELVNTAGFKLLAWPLDNDGLKPGETGNTNTTAAESTDSLEVVDTNAASGTASATTTVSVGMNLNAGQGVFQGATVTITPASAANSSNASDDIIVPASGMEEGDSFTFTSNSVSSTFEYGGFAKSSDLADAAVFGATTATTTFSTGSGLTEGDQFTITSIASGTATFTFRQNSPDTANGQFNSLTSLATAIDSTTGLTARVSGTRLFVSSTTANEAITFGDVSSSDLHNELGFSDEAAAAVGVNRFNTLAGLETLVDAQSQLNATVNNPTSSASLDLFSSDPTLTLTVVKNHNLQDINLSSDENGVITDTEIIVPPNGTESGSGTMIPGTSTLTLTDVGGTDTFTYGGLGRSDAISASNTIFGASTASGGALADTTDRFVDGTGGLDDGDTITFNDGTNNLVLTFDDAATSTLAATEFNSLPTLAAAINADANFRARIVNDRLYVAAADADLQMRVSTTTGITGAQLATAFGGDWTDGGGNVANIVAASGGTTRFATLTELDAMIDAGANTSITGTLTTGANASIALAQDAGLSFTVGGLSNADLLTELGLAAGDNGDGFFTELGIAGTVAASAQSAIVPVTYDPTDSTKNMAGGNVTAHFPRNVRVFDSLGTGHDFRLAFLKTGANRWAVEFYSLAPSEISGGTSDGLVASGTVTFNGDGSLATISSALITPVDISWTTGASNSQITFSLGTAGQPASTPGATVIGLTDGLRQFDSAYNVEFVEQNGVAAGQFSGIEVSEDGTVNARFTNGEIKEIFKIPVLLVSNPNALAQQSGNVFNVTQASGDANLKDAGVGGAGTLVPGALEGSTADIAEELTRTIGIQSNYNANAALISTVRDMEDELNRRI